MRSLTGTHFFLEILNAFRNLKTFISYGFPGKFIARNIPPFSAGEWTDRKLFHAITTGLSKMSQHA